MLNRTNIVKSNYWKKANSIPVLGVKFDKQQFEQDFKKICRISIDSLKLFENDGIH